MKQLMKLLVAGIVCGIGFVGCGLSPTETTTPTITLDAISDIDVGTTKTVTGKVTAGEVITSLAYKIEDANGTAVSTITYEGPSSSTTKEIEFKDNDAIKIKVSPSATAGDYKLVITAVAGSTIDAKFDFKVKGSTGTALTEKTDGVISNVQGLDKGAFDLVTGTRIGSTEAATSKDLLDLSIAGQGFAGKLGSGNSSTFATATTDNYTSATNVSVKALATSATLTEVTVSTVGTVFVVKLGSSRGYAIVKITSYDATGGSSTGNNKGEVHFSYKFTAN
jgi:hypothetical protein